MKMEAVSLNGLGRSELLRAVHTALGTGVPGCLIPLAALDKPESITEMQPAVLFSLGLR